MWNESGMRGVGSGGVLWLRYQVSGKERREDEKEVERTRRRWRGEEIEEEDYGLESGGDRKGSQKKIRSLVEEVEVE